MKIEGAPRRVLVRFSLFAFWEREKGAQALRGDNFPTLRTCPRGGPDEIAEDRMVDRETRNVGALIP